MPTATACTRDDIRAFEYFQKFADSHADDNPATPRSRFVANAFVALGHYYLDGIPNSPVTPSPERARRMFAHAASYFGDPEAQYQLALALSSTATASARDAKRAVPWLVLAANKGQYKAQALLGRILFKGEHGTRQRAARPDVADASRATGRAPRSRGSPSCAKARSSRRPTTSARMALILLKRWVEGRRE